jgi:uncharacterized protein
MTFQPKSKTQSKSGSSSDFTAKQLFTAAMKYCNGDGARKDWRRAFSLCKQSAERGSLDAMDALGSFYTYGIGVRRNFRLAASWYAKAAKRGNLNAQFNLALCYADGHGVPTNYPQAIRWFQKPIRKRT